MPVICRDRFLYCWPSDDNYQEAQGTLKGYDMASTIVYASKGVMHHKELYFRNQIVMIW